MTSGGQAELGRALGGYVNVVTKSGTNNAHGDVYGYFRDDRFNATMRCHGTTLPMNQKQYGGSLGGPIVQNRTFFFGNVEQRKLDQTGLVTIDPDSVDAINARLAACRLSGRRCFDGHLSQPGGFDEPARQAGSSVQRPRPVRRPLQPVQRHVRQLARCRRR